MGNWTFVGAYLDPYSLMSLIHASCSLRPFAEIPITLTPRLAKSGARRATSPSSVVQTGVKSPGWEKRIALTSLVSTVITGCNYMRIHTQSFPIHSWKEIGPLVVSALKSGAMLPSRRAGMFAVAKVRCMGRRKARGGDNRIGLLGKGPAHLLSGKSRLCIDVVIMSKVVDLTNKPPPDHREFGLVIF